MTEINDFYWLWLNRDDGALRGSGPLRPVLEKLDASFLPKPARLEVPGAREARVAGWRDPKVAKALDKGKPTVGLEAPGLGVAFGLGESRVSLTLQFRLGPEPEALRALFLALCAAFRPTFAKLELNNFGQQLYDAHYSRARRTFYASGLSWLNFFGPEEEARQGGAALENNPHAQVERLPHGLFIQVGASPLDGLTPQGEKRLLDATAALPPLPPSPPVAPLEPAAREPAPVVSAGGVRGFANAQGFWVTRHVDPPKPLDLQTIHAIAAVKGHGQVHVLFSAEEAAKVNKALLEEAGVESWFVSMEDGQPRRA